MVSVEGLKDLEGFVPTIYNSKGDDLSRAVGWRGLAVVSAPCEVEFLGCSETLGRYFLRCGERSEVLTIDCAQRILGVVGSGAFDRIRVLLEPIEYLKPVLLDEADTRPVLWKVDWDKLLTQTDE